VTTLFPAIEDLGTAPGFFDSCSDTRFTFHTPFTRPDLWQRYLDGAIDTYSAYGVEEALEIESCINGLSTSLFVLGLSRSEECVAGVRFQGPLVDVDEAHVCREFAGSPGEELVRTTIRDRLPEGIIEFKAGWAAVGYPHHGALSDAIARSFVHAMRWMGVRYGMCSAALYATRRWESTGGRVMEDVEPIPYPNDSYQTTLLWWDAERVALDATGQQWVRIRDEARAMDPNRNLMSTGCIGNPIAARGRLA
jgi:hypothetical protein